MEVSQLRAFLAVADELHFGRAAERLHMAQPPVSRAVAQLEKSLGVRLFDRSTRRVQLTAAGDALIAAARKVLDDIDKAHEIALAAADGDAGRVEISFAGVSTYALVGTLSRELRRRYPRIVPSLQSQHFAQPALERVMHGEVDIALGRWDLVPADIRSRPVLNEHLVMAVPADHALADADEVAIAQFAGQPLVTLAPSPGSVVHDRLRRLCYAAGFEPDVAQTAPDTWTALALVGAGVGCALTVSTVSDNVIDPHVRFKRVIDPVAAITLQMAWLPTSTNPALARVLEVADSTWPTPEH